MLYFKKADLAETYHISVKTITNWIRQAKDGKLPLELVIEGDKAWIANTTSNIALIAQLVEDRRKFRNTRSVKTISPKPEFYTLYNEQQILDICRNLETHSEIPCQYGYFDGGAEYWDKYVQRLAHETNLNNLNAGIHLLEVNGGYLDDLIRPYKRVNVVDVGIGNAMPIKKFLEHLVAKNRMGRYVALDISASMLNIAKKNINTWFGDTVAFEGYEIDIAREYFSPYLVDETLGNHAKETVNIVCVLGDTLSNLRSPDIAFATIGNSMNRQDLLVYARKLDNESSRKYFDFSVGEKMLPLDTNSKLVPDLLNIDESLYDVEMGFDEELRQRYIRIRFKVAIELVVEFNAGQRVIKFNKNDAILLWRSQHQTVHDILHQLESNNLDTLQASQTNDQNYLLTISRIKRTKS